MGVGAGVKLRGRDGGHAELHDKKPAELEVARPGGDVGGESVGGGEGDAGEVDEDEVAALGGGVLLFLFCKRRFFFRGGR